MAKIEECTSASEVTKSLTILNAIRWVAEAWKAVLPETVQKCFRKAGILTRNFEVVQPVVADDSDPFADLDSDMNDVCQLQLIVNSAASYINYNTVKIVANHQSYCLQRMNCLFVVNLQMRTGMNNLWLSLVPAVAKILLLMKKAKMKTTAKVCHRYLSLL